MASPFTNHDTPKVKIAVASSQKTGASLKIAELTGKNFTTTTKNIQAKITYPQTAYTILRFNFCGVGGLVGSVLRNNLRAKNAKVKNKAKAKNPWTLPIFIC